MSAYDKNKIFFGLIHYILSEQHNVDWILKTSLVNFTGLNTTISNKKFKQNSVSDDIIEYIYQVKPYHVQFEQFIEKHSSKDDIAKINAIDANNVQINIRFDAIQPYADIDKTFYEYYPIKKDDEMIDENNLPKYGKNFEGMIIFSEFYNDFFERHYNEEEEKWEWIKLNYELLSTKYYFASNNDALFRVIYKNGIKTLEKLSNDELYEFMNTHKANRIWYAKRNIFTNKKDMDEYIIDVLNAHFKGVSVDGSKFDFGNMGYDAFLYDEKLYDEPTISNVFCAVDFSEPNINYNYTKSFIKVGVRTLLLESDREILEGNCQIIYEYGNDAGVIDNFSIVDNMVKLPRKLRMYEKITVIETAENIKTAYVFVAHPFIEDDDVDSSLMKKFIDYRTDTFEIPENNIGSRKVLVYLIKSNGSKKIISNFEEKDGCVILNEQININDKVQVTVIDYRRVYDKIYTWEDRYGNSNNIITLDGDKFLRANYEEGRPSELAVSYPLDSSMIYLYTDNGKADLYQINWKNDQGKMTISSSMQTTLSKPIALGDSTIEVEDISRIFKPTEGQRGKINPAKILINSEIIEYHEIERNGNKAILKGIRRAACGSILNEYIPVEYTDETGSHKTLVYAYSDQSMVDYNPRSVYISTLFKEGMENKFIIPSKVLDESKVVVYKKPIINLISDITFESSYFDISSNNIELPTEDKMGYLYINDDKVYFNKITKKRNNYRIEKFNITKEYKAADSIILSKNYEELKKEDYEIICNQDEDYIQHMYIDYNYVYNPIDNSIIGIYAEENNKKIVYKIGEEDTKLGKVITKSFIIDSHLVIKKVVIDDSGNEIGYGISKWNNIIIDSLDENSNYEVIGYIKGNEAFEFDKSEIIGYVNKQNEIVDDNDKLVEYPYIVKYKDAYIILNETPKPFECILVGNEK